MAPQPCLDRLDKILIGLTIAVISVVTIGRLPPGICSADSGGLQLACATLGITHPPGYAGYASLGYLFTLVPGVDPAYMVSLASWGCGLITLWLCILIQVRLGVAVGVACALALVLTAFPRVWSNLLVPEVYLPSLLFEAAAAYMIMAYAGDGRPRSLYLGAALFGFVLANRPPAVFAFPFFLVAAWLACRRRGASLRASAARLALASAFGVLPGIYTVGYLWVRDAPDTPYNYLEQFNAEAGILPESEDGAAAKAHRIFWLVTGRQFGDKMGNTLTGVRYKLLWLRNELLPFPWEALQLMPYRLIVAIDAFAILTLGVVLAGRRCPVAMWLLAGMGLGSILFVCLYRVNGDAADILPLLFALTVLIGVAISPLLPARGNAWQRGVAVSLAIAALAATTVLAPARRKTGLNMDALPFLAELDMPSLPQDTVICSHWGSSTPLWYAQRFIYNRPDVTVINAPDSEWARLTEDLRELPIFGTDPPAPEYGFAAEPYRNLWRLEYQEATEGASPP